MKNKIEMVLSKIGDVEERIYNEFGDDEIELKVREEPVVEAVKRVRRKRDEL
jgi:hypothetical protein